MLQNQIWRSRDPELARHVDRATRYRFDALKSAWRWLGEAVLRSYHTQVKRRRAHLAVRELRALDSRLLRDIGIASADDIPAVVQGLAGRRSPPASRSGVKRPRRPQTAPAVAECCA